MHSLVSLLCGDPRPCQPARLNPLPVIRLIRIVLLLHSQSVESPQGLTKLLPWCGVVVPITIPKRDPELESKQQFASLV